MDFMEDKVLRMSAALAYYTVFSLPGMLLIVIFVSDLFIGRAAVEGTLYHQIAEFVGVQAAQQIQQALRNATASGFGNIAAVMGLVTLIFGATSVFGEIQDSINYIWRLKAKPKKGWLKLLWNRLVSFSMVVSLGFLLLVSLLINAVLDIFINKLIALFPEIAVVLVYATNLLLTFLITSFLFAIIFKFLPDAKVEWKHVRAGAFTTAILFMIGKSLIGFYLGQSRMTDVYGAAGSIIVILLWVYYSSMILYFGAEFTRVYALHHGAKIYPNDYAVWIKQIEIESEQAISENNTNRPSSA